MPTRNASLHNPPTTPRRSQRLLLKQDHNTPKPQAAKSNNPTKKSSLKSKNCSVVSRKSPRSNDAVVEIPSLRRSPRFTNQKKNPPNEKNDKKLSKSDKCSGDLGNPTSVKGCEAQTKENRVVLFEGIRVEGEGKMMVRNEEKVEAGVKRKRGGKEIAKGWTKEQELALQRAYFSAKPSPHFWKNVSRLVPGKSQQDCFDRIHRDHITPPQPQPRSRAKTLNSSSPLHQFSISASKLLKPIEKTVRRSNVLKPKSYITQKSIEKLLQRHLNNDLDCDGDIFSVLEPNIDLSTDASHPSDGLSTPKQLKQNKGLLQNCTETSSSHHLHHKKSLSRLGGSCVTNLGSPPVLKQVKNKVQHEKYVNQLRFREARRRAASTRTQKQRSGKIIEGNSIQKRDAVKAAKVALVSEARDAISKFQQSQANVMNTCSSDEDIDDDTGIEYESQ